MTDLEALAARVEGAIGPDRELDAAIGLLVGGFFLAEPRFPGARRMYGYVDADGGRVEPGNGAADRLIPTYTASLDAAMTLVPADWNITLRGVNDSWHVTMNATSFGPLRQSFAFAQSAACAITAAALRARAHLGGTHDR